MYGWNDRPIYDKIIERKEVQNLELEMSFEAALESWHTNDE